MVKRNQNTIGLDLRPEAKRKPQQDRTRNVNVPRFRNVHKMHLMDIKIDRDSSRDRARGQQRSGVRGQRVASGRLWAVATDKFGSFGYFYTYILVVHPKSVGSCLHLSAHTGWLGPQQMPWQSRFLICMENCLRAAPPSPPWLLFIPFCALSLSPFGAGNWRVAAATHRQRERERVQHSVLHPHLCYKCNCCYSPPPVTLPPSFNANVGRPVGRIGAEGICFTYLTN